MYESAFTLVDLYQSAMASHDDYEDFTFLCGGALALLEDERKRKKRRKERRWWQGEFLRKRATHGAYAMLVQELTLEDGAYFRNYVRMSMEDFSSVLSLVAPLVCKTNTNFQEAIPPEDQLAVTLRFLATGDSFSTLMYLHRISKSAICNIILRVCEAIVQVLSPEVKLPASEEEWLKIAQDFEEKWNFPRCLGAIDGRHIDIVAPPNSGTVYYNYKERFSIVLLAIADANYRIIYADVGTQGKISDGGVLKDTNFYKMLENKTLHIPPPALLPGRNKPVPYVFVTDEAFGLEENILKPVPGQHEKNSWQRIFNYRMCRARRVIENVFGIISAVFRVLRKQMLLSPEKATVVTLACVYLHNFLQNRRSQTYVPAGTYDRDGEDGNVIPGSWRETPTLLEPLPRTGRRTSLLNDNRREYAEYFCSIQGSIPWQYGK